MSQAEELHTEATTPANSHSESHEITLFAEPIINIGNFEINNSFISSWVVVLFVIILVMILKSKLSKIPRGIQNIFEMVLEGALNMADSVTGDRNKSMKLFPVAFGLFIFILLNNWLGLLPGVGTIGFYENGETFVPFLRGATADLNTTFVLAIFSIIFTHVMGIIAIGAWKHLNKFIGIKLFLEIPKKIRKEPTIILINPIKAFVGLIEIVGEIAKVASLAFRLFGNIFAGEVLLASMMALMFVIVPIPFMFLEIIVGLIQALIFAMLVLVFGTISMQDSH
ncbi:MAG: FoF1 ATP synthase subunit a [Patescibacteria group bacterium]